MRTIDINKKPLLNRRDAAKFLGGEIPLAIGTLAVWDCTKRYDLKPQKIDGKIHYPRSVLEQFLQQKQGRISRKKKVK